MSQDYGFRVSMPGNDVLDTNIKPENILYSTEFSSPKILAEGSSFVTIAASQEESDTWTFTHNHGVPLAYLIYYKSLVPEIGEEAYFLSPTNTNLGMEVPTDVPFSVSDLNAEDVSDRNSISFKVSRGTTSGGIRTVHFKYYLLLEPLAEFSGNLTTNNFDYGFKISKPDKDIISTKEHDMAFTSSRKFFKLKEIVREQVGLPLLEAGESTGLLAFRHDLGYYPAFWAYATHPFTSGIYDLPLGKLQAGATVTQAAVAITEAFVTKTHFYFRLYRRAGTGTSFMGPYVIDWAKKLYDLIYITTYEKLA